MARAILGGGTIGVGWWWWWWWWWAPTQNHVREICAVRVPWGFYGLDWMWVDGAKAGWLGRVIGCDRCFDAERTILALNGRGFIPYDCIGR